MLDNGFIGELIASENNQKKPKATKRKSQCFYNCMSLAAVSSIFTSDSSICKSDGSMEYLFMLRKADEDRRP